jgi:sporulation-control protein spo0M
LEFITIGPKEILQRHSVVRENLFIRGGLSAQDADKLNLKLLIELDNLPDPGVSIAYPRGVGGLR